MENQSPPFSNKKRFQDAVKVLQGLLSQGVVRAEQNQADWIEISAIDAEVYNSNNTNRHQKCTILETTELTKQEIIQLSEELHGLEGQQETLSYKIASLKQKIQEKKLMFYEFEDL